MKVTVRKAYEGNERNRIAIGWELIYEDGTRVQEINPLTGKYTEWVYPTKRVAQMEADYLNLDADRID